jgi:hypothetical protein
MRPKKSVEEKKQTQRLWREKNKEYLRELKKNGTKKIIKIIQNTKHIEKNMQKKI